MPSQKLFSINPCNGLVMAEFGADEPAAIAHKIDSAYRAF